MIGNFVTAALSLLAICAVVGLLTWGMAVLVDLEPSVRQVAEAVLNLWPVCIMFGALALLCSALFHRKGLAIAIPAFLLFGMYLLDTIGRASEVLRPVSDFYSYGSAIENGIDWADFGGIILVALALVLLAVLVLLLAVLVFGRRDIYMLTFGNRSSPRDRLLPVLKLLGYGARGHSGIADQGASNRGASRRPGFAGRAGPPVVARLAPYGAPGPGRRR